MSGYQFCGCRIVFLKQVQLYISGYHLYGYTFVLLRQTTVCQDNIVLDAEWSFEYKCSCISRKHWSRCKVFLWRHELVVLSFKDLLVSLGYFVQNMFIHQEQLLHFVWAEALVCQLFYNSDFYEHGLWGYHVPLVYSIGYYSMSRQRWSGYRVVLSRQVWHYGKTTFVWR